MQTCLVENAQLTFGWKLESVYNIMYSWLLFYMNRKIGQTTFLNIFVCIININIYSLLNESKAQYSIATFAGVLVQKWQLGSIPLTLSKLHSSITKEAINVKTLQVLQAFLLYLTVTCDQLAKNYQTNPRRDTGGPCRNAKHDRPTATPLWKQRVFQYDIVS